MISRAGRKTFRLILIKPSHYDDDGYVIQWVRSPIPANSLACLYGLARDCRERGAREEQRGEDKGRGEPALAPLRLTGLWFVGRRLAAEIPVVIASEPSWHCRLLLLRSSPWPPRGALNVACDSIRSRLRCSRYRF